MLNSDYLIFSPLFLLEFRNDMRLLRKLFEVLWKFYDTINLNFFFREGDYLEDTLTLFWLLLLFFYIIIDIVIPIFGLSDYSLKILFDTPSPLL